jgi:hypothetical protein
MKESAILVPASRSGERPGNWGRWCTRGGAHSSLLSFFSIRAAHDAQVMPPVLSSAACSAVGMVTPLSAGRRHRPFGTIQEIQNGRWCLSRASGFLAAVLRAKIWTMPG